MLPPTPNHKQRAQVILEVALVIVSLAVFSITSLRLFSNLNLNMTERIDAYRDSRLAALNSGGPEPTDYLYAKKPVAPAFTPGKSVDPSFFYEDESVAEANYYLQEENYILNVILPYKVNQAYYLAKDFKESSSSSFVYPLNLYNNYNNPSNGYGSVAGYRIEWPLPAEHILSIMELMRDSASLVKEAYGDFINALGAFSRALNQPKRPGMFDPITPNINDPIDLKDPKMAEIAAAYGLPRSGKQIADLTEAEKAEIAAELKSKRTQHYANRVMLQKILKAPETNKERVFHGTINIGGKEMSIEGIRSSLSAIEGLQIYLYGYDIASNRPAAPDNPQRPSTIWRINKMLNNFARPDSFGFSSNKVGLNDNLQWEAQFTGHQEALAGLADLLGFVSRVNLGNLPIFFAPETTNKIQNIYNIIGKAKLVEKIAQKEAQDALADARLVKSDIQSLFNDPKTQGDKRAINMLLQAADDLCNYLDQAISRWNNIDNRGAEDNRYQLLEYAKSRLLVLYGQINENLRQWSDNALNIKSGADSEADGRLVFSFALREMINDLYKRLWKKEVTAGIDPNRNDLDLAAGGIWSLTREAAVYDADKKLKPIREELINVHPTLSGIIEQLNGQFGRLKELYPRLDSEKQKRDNTSDSSEKKAIQAKIDFLEAQLNAEIRLIKSGVKALYRATGCYHYPGAQDIYVPGQEIVNFPLKQLTGGETIEELDIFEGTAEKNVLYFFLKPYDKDKPYSYNGGNLLPGQKPKNPPFPYKYPEK